MNLRGTGIHSAFDYARSTIERIDPKKSDLIPISIDQYGLNDKHVLDSIARLASAEKPGSIKIYNGTGAFTPPKVSPQTMQDLFAYSKQQNCTFNIEYLEQHIPEISALSIDMSAVFGATVAIHAFVTAAGVPATPLHYDYSDAFTFQLHGAKWWQCFEYHDAPTFEPGGYVVHQNAVGSTCLDHVLKPGECLFIPKGGLHLATALSDQNSVHLAVSVKPLEYYKLLAQMVSAELEHPGWKGLRFEQHIEDLTTSLKQCISSMTSTEVLVKAQLAVWQIIYRLHARVSKSKPNVAGSADSRSEFSRVLGRPLSAMRLQNAIALEFLDVDVQAVGSFGFHPARVEFPVEAEPFVRMLETGDLDRDRLSTYYDLSTVEDLLGLSIQLGLFRKNQRELTPCGTDQALAY